MNRQELDALLDEVRLLRELSKSNMEVIEELGKQIDRLVRENCALHNQLKELKCSKV